MRAISRFFDGLLGWIAAIILCVTLVVIIAGNPGAFAVAFAIVAAGAMIARAIRDRV